MKGTRMIHQVQDLPREGEYVRAKCGRPIADPRSAAVHKSDIPEGETLCRGACWREGLSYKSKVILLEELIRTTPGETIPRDELLAILEGPYYPNSSYRSPKAA